MRKILPVIILFAAACSNPSTSNDAEPCEDGLNRNPVTGECDAPSGSDTGIDTGADTGGDDRDMRFGDTDPDADRTPDTGPVDAGPDASGEDSGPADVDPGPVEVCDNDVDDNGDGDVDCLDADCAATAACGMCTFVPAPEEVLEAPLEGETNPGGHEMINQGNFTDDYVFNSAGTNKIGTRRDWGGTIIFFGQDDGSSGINATNVIDANDTGREVQVAFYDPDRRTQNCAWNASCATTSSDCPNSITYLGWNPVQGGNRCNAGSGTQAVDFADGRLEVQTQPLHWNPNWDRMDCVSEACNDAQLRMRRTDVLVRQRLRFVSERVVELDYVVQNMSNLDHRATGQEFPTVYTANGQVGPDLWRLFDSNGTEISIDQPANDGFMMKPFSSPGGWVTMQNQNLDYGVGHYTENRLQDWTGWQLRTLPFNNFRPTFVFGLPANGTVRARSYLILGSKGTVEAEALWLDQNLPPFGVADTPTADQEVTGATLNVAGWALDNKGVTAVSATIDGGAPVALNYGNARPDVCIVWPQYPGCDNVGYQGSVDVSGLSECAHLLEVRATDADGNTRVIERRRFIVTP